MKQEIRSVERGYLYQCRDIPRFSTTGNDVTPISPIGGVRIQN